MRKQRRGIVGSCLMTLPFIMFLLCSCTEESWLGKLGAAVRVTTSAQHARATASSCPQAACQFWNCPRCSRRIHRSEVAWRTRYDAPGGRYEEGVPDPIRGADRRPFCSRCSCRVYPVR